MVTGRRQNLRGGRDSLRLRDTGSRGSISAAVEAMEYVIDNDIRVSNHSWGTSTYSQALYDVVEASQAIGHLLVASAGNCQKNTDVFPHYPSSYDLPNVISVAATNNDDELAWFSNFGPTTVDLGAPGVNVYSTVLGDGYDYLNGTSMAAPHVTGVVAWVMSRRPDWTWAEVKNRVLAGVRPVDSLIHMTFTGGVVNAMNIGDCNQNGMADEVDIAAGTSEDCSGNGIPDECERDCNGNELADSCDIYAGSSDDCNGNSIPDECEPDCNDNGIADSCDIAAGTSEDCTYNVIPDECEPDCNDNGIADSCDIANAVSKDCTDNGIPDECETLPDCNGNGVADLNEICNALSPDCNANEVPDQCDVVGGTSADCSGNRIPDECEPDCNYNGVADSCDIADGTSVDVNGNDVPDECDVIAFVDADAPAGGDGASWLTAYTDLQLALMQETATEIWVAAGTYAPAPPGSDRNATFSLSSGVRVYGGFVGGEVRLDHRNPARDRTILTGDLNGDDGPDWSNRLDNSYNVVTGDYVDETAVLDGFTITGGYHDQSSSTYYGGAIHISDGSPTVANCLFIGNSSLEGGGACITGYYSSPTFTNCAFIDNRGRGVANYGQTTLVNCIIHKNWGGGGAAAHNGSSRHFTLINCTLSMNYAASGTGGIRSFGVATLDNCVLWGNTSADCSGEAAQIDVSDYGTIYIGHSCVEGWTGTYGGIGNIGDDPRFVNPDGQDGILGTEDDDLRLSSQSPCIDAADNTLLPVSVATDVAGLPRFLENLDAPDTGNPGVPGLPVADMGAHEYSPDCNGNYHDDAADILSGTSMDCNGNTVPDECDVARGISEDCTGNVVPDECEALPDCNANETADHNDICEGRSEDCNDNGVPDECDLALGTSADCNSTDIPDECEDDCNENGLADECDLAAGTSADLNANGAPDECEVPKNRYISFVPDRGGEAVAYQVTLTASGDFPGAVGLSWWVDAPDSAGIARLADAPVIRDWSGDRTLIQAADCPIVPVATYEIRSTADGVIFSDPTIVATTGRPVPKQWGDVVGQATGIGWTGPNEVVNMDDVMAMVQRFQMASTAPLLTWVDIDGEMPNGILNFTDILRVVQGFKGEPYPFSDPADCP